MTQRITCKMICSCWDTIDKDCHIYGQYHFCPRTCPFFKQQHLDKYEELFKEKEKGENNVQS